MICFVIQCMWLCDMIDLCFLLFFWISLARDLTNLLLFPNIIFALSISQNFALIFDWLPSTFYRFDLLFFLIQILLILILSQQNFQCMYVRNFVLSRVSFICFFFMNKQVSFPKTCPPDRQSFPIVYDLLFQPSNELFASLLC